MAMQVQSICGVGRAIEVSFDVEIEIGALVHENGEVKNVAILDDMNDAMVSLRAQSTSADLNIPRLPKFQKIVSTLLRTGILGILINGHVLE